jgi:hypothetical protein
MVRLAWGLAALLVLAAALAVVRACFSTLVFAAYPGTFEFSGFRRLWSNHYSSVKWVRDPGDNGPCPVVIHTDRGDIGAAELADPGRLLARGWVVVPFAPIAPEATALIGEHGDDLPPVVKYGWGDLRVCPQFTDGLLTTVSVWVVGPGEMWEHRPGAARYPISVGGRRVSLPISEAELTQALGRPADLRDDY